MTNPLPLEHQYKREYARLSTDAERDRMRELYTAFQLAVTEDRAAFDQKQLDGKILMVGFEKENGTPRVRRYDSRMYATALLNKGIYAGPFIVYEHKDDPALGKGTIENTAESLEHVVDSQSDTRLILRPGTI